MSLLPTRTMSISGSAILLMATTFMLTRTKTTYCQAFGFVNVPFLPSQRRSTTGIPVFSSPSRPLISSNVNANVATTSTVHSKKRRLFRAAKDMNGTSLGHVYQQVGGDVHSLTCALTMTDIHLLIAKRVRLLEENKNADADAMLFELFIHGVHVSDEPPMWRADGVTTFHSSVKPTPRKAIEYQEEKTEQNRLQAETRASIQILLRNRAVAMAGNDKNQVGSITFELYKSYGVAVDDDRFVWKVGDFQEPWEPPKVLFPLTQPYKSQTSSLLPMLFTENGFLPEKVFTMSPFTNFIPSPRIVARIEQMIQKRATCQEIKNFSAADALKNELWETYRVGINDNLCQWSVGGYFAERKPLERISPSNETLQWGKEPSELERVYRAKAISSTAPAKKVTTVVQSVAQAKPYHRLYQESKLEEYLDAERLPTVENLIRYIDTQQLSNPNIVARLMIRLEEEYGITFTGNKWKLGQTNETPVYLPRDNVENIPAAILNQIQELVTTRNIEKFERKSKFTPDIIEGALHSKHRVVIDDNYRVWFIE